MLATARALRAVKQGADRRDVEFCTNRKSLARCQLHCLTRKHPDVAHVRELVADLRRLVSCERAQKHPLKREPETSHPAASGEKIRILLEDLDLALAGDLDLHLRLLARSR